MDEADELLGGAPQIGGGCWINGPENQGKWPPPHTPLVAPKSNLACGKHSDMPKNGMVTIQDILKLGSKTIENDKITLKGRNNAPVNSSPINFLNP